MSTVPLAAPGNSYPTLTTEAKQHRDRALAILPGPERELYKELIPRFSNQRHHQHPTPDRATVLRHLQSFLPSHDQLETLRQFLETNPCRIRQNWEPAGIDLCLFAPDGYYVSVADDVQDVAGVKADREFNKRGYLFPRIGCAGHFWYSDAACFTRPSTSSLSIAATKFVNPTPEKSASWTEVGRR
ncbi:hypothetical protein B0H19DRAFT_1378286, partial [Mycena capillaripes]